DVIRGKQERRSEEAAHDSSHEYQVAIARAEQRAGKQPPEDESGNAEDDAEQPVSEETGNRPATDQDDGRGNLSAERKHVTSPGHFPSLVSWSLRPRIRDPIPPGFPWRCASRVRQAASTVARDRAPWPRLQPWDWWRG